MDANGVQGFQGASSTPKAMKGGGGMEIGFDVARRNPRIISEFRRNALTMATIDQETAASCFYKLKRGDTTIEGPSIRLAEIVAACWKNLLLGSSILGEEGNAIVAEAKVCDLEANNWITTENRRRITGKNGQRYSEDMVIMTANAASSLALRNAVFTAVPRSYVNSIVAECKKVAIGNAKSIGERRQAMVGAFAKMGVNLDRVLAYLKVPSLEDVDAGSLEDALGLFNAIKDGDITLDEALPEPKKAAPEAPKATTPTPTTGTQPEAGKAAPEAGEKATEPEPQKATGPTPEDIKKRKLQDYNRQYAKAKTDFGKEAVEEALEKVGIPPNTFPSKMSPEQLENGLGALEILLTPKPTEGEQDGQA